MSNRENSNSLKEILLSKEDEMHRMQIECREEMDESIKYYIDSLKQD